MEEVKVKKMLISFKHKERNNMGLENSRWILVKVINDLNNTPSVFSVCS